MTRRLLVRLRKSLRRVEVRGRRIESGQVDREWRSMLARLEAEDRERRLRDAEAALNKLRS